MLLQFYAQRVTPSGSGHSVWRLDNVRVPANTKRISQGQSLKAEWDHENAQNVGL